ncbi:MAG: hypothetical protein IT236_05630 [Bacteroidia bacterium]|nr:hypothetical protein [Bacteroidia bacterium]
MKITKLYFALSILFITGLILSACLQRRPKVNAVNPAFAKYISGYTSGVVSRKTKIRIELATSPLESSSVAESTSTLNTTSTNETQSIALLPDSSLLKDAFIFDPEIKGHAYWVNERVIQFVPDQALLPNQLYDVEFKLKNVAKVDSKLEEFNFQLSTFPQNIVVEVKGLNSYGNYNMEWQQLSGTLKIADYEDVNLLSRIITVTQEGKILPVHLTPNSTYEAYNREFSFTVDSVERKATAGKLIISWDGERIHSTDKGSVEWPVSSLSDFTVNDISIIGEDNQTLQLNFSDPILYGQNLKGIITVEGVNDLTYSIEGNFVKVFLPNRYEGDKMVTVNTGIKNFKKFDMNKSFSSTVTFQAPEPQIRLVGKGCILPNSSGLIFPFEAISLKAVDVRVIKILENNVHQFLQVNDLDGESQLYRVGKVIAEERISLSYDKKKNLKQWNKHVIDLGKIISPEPGAIYRVSIRFDKSYALCVCEGTTNTSAIPDSPTTTPREEWNEYDWDYYGFDSGYDHWDYYNDESLSPCNNDYYRGKAESRNILASDIGIIYKLDDNKFSHAFISNLITAKPLPNTQVEYYDYTHQLITSGTTDGNGMLDLQLKRKPFLMVARHGKQRGYLKLQDGAANSLSKFDVEGEVVQEGVKGFIYGDRGVWRPGDSLYLNFIMEDKEKRLPANHPVKFELQDANSQIIYNVTKTKNANGLYDFRTATGAEAPTGNYLAVVRVGNRVFTKNIKIETVKPNRLKINLDFADKSLGDSLAKISVKWLHGAPAKNLETMISVKLNQTKTSFDKFKNYEFDSPVRTYYSESDMIFSNTLNEKGESYFKKVRNVQQNAPGMLRASYITKVFEEGGDFSIDRYSIAYSPYKTYVGLHTPETKTYDNSLETGRHYVFDVVTLNEKSEAVNLANLQVKVYKIEWRWWYDRNQEDLSQYVSRAGTIVVQDTLIKTNNGKGYFKFGVNYPEYGRYLITVTDPKGGHQTGKVVCVDWPYWSRGNRNNSEDASMLNFASDKQKYTTGEKIKLSFPSPADGMALVSIETGLKVVNKFWVPTTKGETVYEFPATANMAPSAYIHVTLIQPHASTKNDLPIRMYGVIPIQVDEPRTHLIPEIKMADVIKPESSVKIKIAEKNSRKMNYTIAMVDEGLLDLTRFQTPQPWSTFYAREALGVKTWDMYEAVIGAYAGKLDKLLSIGGDGDANAGKGIKANRFKPMVKCLGPFTIEAGAEKIHTVQIPNYVGSVRVMVVTENEGAYGNAEKAVAVRKPLMLLATLPRVLGPGEEVYLPVDIFAMEKHIKDVKIEVQVNELLTLSGGSQQSLHFTEIGDDVINFKLTTALQTGIAKVKITATCGQEKTTQEIELDIRTPNPKVSDGKDIVIEPGKEFNGDINFIGITGTNKATIELSSVPQMGLESRLTYLVQYPHGCIEQTTSSVFPQLFVMNLLDLNESQKSGISNNIKAGIKRLQLFQTSNGGFSYWPGEGYDSEWGSNYAGHFMIEAEKHGFNLPVNMKTRWIKYQQQKARNWNINNNEYTHAHGHETNEIIQAYRLFVLALSNNPELGAMNRLREEKNLSLPAKWRLAATYKLVGQNEVALALIQNLSTSVAHYNELSYSYGSDTRDEAMILETLSLLNDRAKATPIAQTLAKKLSSNVWMSTQETAYSLLAMCEFTGAKENAGGFSFDYALNENAGKNYVSKKTIHQIKLNDKDINRKAPILLRNTGKSTLYAKIIVEGVPLVGDKTASFKDLKMLVKYKDMKGNEIKPDFLEQGTDFTAEVTIANPGTKGFLKEMALNQIFPSGWEIHNDRLDGTEASSAARYQDIRDDRVYSYYDLAENTNKTFIVRLNATYLGKFYLPTIYSEAMYDNTINARVPGRWVEVVKNLNSVSKK